MSSSTKSCPGHYDFLADGSESLVDSAATKKIRQLKCHWSNTVWHIENKGLWGTLKVALSKIARFFTGEKALNKSVSVLKRVPAGEDVLNLRSGDLVEVKSEEEILATLDENKKNKGLLWMIGMRRFCGKKVRVYKRLERILLESTGEHRQLKNTVLLEDAVCDGLAFGGCDRSCFHYWRECWLRRVEDDRDF